MLQDGKLSDDVKPLLDLIKLNGLVRQAVKLLKGVEIRHNDNTLTLGVLTKFPFYKVRLGSTHSHTRLPASLRGHAHRVKTRV